MAHRKLSAQGHLGYVCATEEGLVLVEHAAPGHSTGQVVGRGTSGLEAGQGGSGLVAPHTLLGGRANS